MPTSITPPLTPSKRKASDMSATSAAPSLLNFDLPPIPQLDLPPIPRISDPRLEQQVFTHSSYYKKLRRATSLETDEVIEDNEKLEHVGDSILGCVVTLLLHRLYPNLQVGPATTLKSLLVANSTLAQIASQYDLPSRLIAGKAELYSVRSGEKTRANLLESYVAGLYLSLLGERTTQPGCGSGVDGLRLPTPPWTQQDEAAKTNIESGQALAGLQVAGVSPSATGPRTRATPSAGLSSTTGDSSSAAPDLADPADDRAFATLTAWLNPLFRPLADWALAQLRAEQARLDARVLEETPDAALEKLAFGASARLNEHCIVKEGGMPEYAACRAGEAGWTVLCTVTLRDGRKISESATTTNKKSSQNVAARKLCEAMSLSI